MEITQPPTRQSVEARVDELTDQLVADHLGEPDVEFLGAQFDAGLAFVSFPEGHGGLGASPGLQRNVNQRIVKAGGPIPPLGIGHGMAAPTITAHGTEDQQDQWLRPLFTGEEVWCQLFSEPGAGSDVASLATTAVRDGDEWIVNGQKVWTSLAHHARWGLLFARTDPDVPKHRGMTYFVIDMHQPGVEVRPLRQMTGQAEFNEVYFTDARVPDANRIGDVGDGWRVGLTTLMNERVSIGGSSFGGGWTPIQWVLATWRERQSEPRGAKSPQRSERGPSGPARSAESGMLADHDAVRRDEVMRAWVDAEVLRLTNLRAAAARTVGVPGPEGSIAKLAAAELNQRIFALCENLLGPDGMLFPKSYEMDRSHTGLGYDTVQEWFLRSRANSIEGGTSEVMRNILGERVLGLPGDIRVDKDVAWREVPRN